METVVLKLRGQANSPYARKESELVIPVTYDASIDGTEYGSVNINGTFSISNQSESVIFDGLEVKDVNGNFQFGADTYIENELNTFNPDSSSYSDSLLVKFKSSYGYRTGTIKIYFKKKNNGGGDGIIDIKPLESFDINFLGQEGLGRYVTTNTKSKAKTPISLTSLPLLNSKVSSLNVSDLNCGIDEIPFIFPKITKINAINMLSFNIDNLKDSVVEVINITRIDGDLNNLPTTLKKIKDTYDEIGTTSYSGDGSAKFTQLNSVLLYTSAKSLSQKEMDKFLECLANSTWSGNEMKLHINAASGVTLNPTSISTIRDKGVTIME